jgi:hypothetical protein
MTQLHIIHREISAAILIHRAIRLVPFLALGRRKKRRAYKTLKEQSGDRQKNGENGRKRSKTAKEVR